MKTGDVEYTLCPIWNHAVFFIEVVGLFFRCTLGRGCDLRNRQIQNKWPTTEEMEESSDIFQNSRPHLFALRGVFAVSNGARLLCADFVHPETQNAFYNAMSQNVEATNLLVWNFKGEIIDACVNFPGSWHYSKLAYVSGMYWPSLIEDLNTPPGFGVLGDSAFVNNTKTTKGKVV
eukprot:gb/GEZJ01005981.1/.p1 GENE.gb/GEZJ01005981.1/~~gb/GEZJ01005981.1/.p1  ORF type:complete len:176 (+),score=10.95 gb/GEZJ01005981.1/:539-1066(+)